MGIGDLQYELDEAEDAYTVRDGVPGLLRVTHSKKD